MTNRHARVKHLSLWVKHRMLWWACCGHEQRKRFASAPTFQDHRLQSRFLVNKSTNNRPFGHWSNLCSVSRTPVGLRLSHTHLKYIQKYFEICWPHPSRAQHRKPPTMLESPVSPGASFSRPRWRSHGVYNGRIAEARLESTNKEHPTKVEGALYFNKLNTGRHTTITSLCTCRHVKGIQRNGGHMGTWGDFAA